MDSQGPHGTDAGALRPPMSVLEPSTGMNRHQKARTQQGLGEGHDVAYGGLGEDYCYYGSVEEMHSCIDWTD